MSKVKYRVREYIPKNEGQGSHSWYAEAVVTNDVDNSELASKIAARTGFKSYECQAVIAAIADIVAEEVCASNRVFLADERGTKMVSLYPRVQGSVSDAEVLANPKKYEGATAATEAMVTPDILSWTVGATVGIKFSKEFALRKQAMKVKAVFADASSGDEDEQESPQGADIPSGGGGDTPAGGGGDNPGGGGGDNGGGGTGNGNGEDE